MLIRVLAATTMLLAAVTAIAEEIVSTTNGKSSIVVIRPLKAVAGDAVNVYINGEYLSSLRPGSSAQVSVCPGVNRINVAVSDVRTRYREKEEAGQVVTQNANTTRYYAVNMKDGVVVATALDDARAMRYLSEMPRNPPHTISRVTPRACDLK